MGKYQSGTSEWWWMKKSVWIAVGDETWSLGGIVRCLPSLFSTANYLCHHWIIFLERELDKCNDPENHWITPEPLTSLLFKISVLFQLHITDYLSAFCKKLELLLCLKCCNLDSFLTDVSGVFLFGWFGFSVCLCRELRIYVVLEKTSKQECCVLNL